MHKVFISYHHSNDQWYKNELVKFGERIFGATLKRCVNSIGGDYPSG